MGSVSVLHITAALATAQRLYSIGGFTRVGNAERRYREFGEDIRCLALNLDLISAILQQAEAQHLGVPALDGPRKGDGDFSGDTTVHQLLGNPLETLTACERLLEDGGEFIKLHGFMPQTSWYDQVDPLIQTLRGQIAHHNFELSVALSILDPWLLGNRLIQIHDPVTSMFRVLEQLGRQARGEDDELRYDSPEDTTVTPIPLDLESPLRAFGEDQFPHLSTLPLCRGIEAAVSHFNRAATMQSQQSADERYSPYLRATISLIKTAWLLRTIKLGKEYQRATQYYLLNPLERQLECWGWSVVRFFYAFEEKVQEAYRSLLGRNLLLPPVSDLLGALEVENTGVNNGNLQKTPTFSERDTVLEQLELGTRILVAQMRDAAPGYNQTLQLYLQTEKRVNLQLVRTAVSEGREKETIDGFDLDSVQIMPWYARRTLTTPPSEPQTVRLRIDAKSPLVRNLVFHHNKDMFAFQQAVTGFRVVHDDARVLATSHQSKLLAGSTRQDLCRLQIWTSPSPNHANTDGNYNALTPQTTLSTTSTSASGRTMSVAGSLSSAAASSLTVAAFATGAASDVLPAGRPVVHLPPVTPCIVLFAHRVPGKGFGGGGDVETSLSFMVIDLTPEVVVEVDTAASTSSYRCIIETRGSNLAARRSHETPDAGCWDLAVAGLHKRQSGTEAVKRLKYVMIQFDSQNNLEEFVTKCKQIRDLARIRLAKFLQGS